MGSHTGPYGHVTIYNGDSAMNVQELWDALIPMSGIEIRGAADIPIQSEVGMHCMGVIHAVATLNEHSTMALGALPVGTLVYAARICQVYING